MSGCPCETSPCPPLAPGADTAGSVPSAPAYDTPLVVPDVPTANQCGVYWNTAQTFIAECGAGYTGTPVTITIPKETYLAISQAEADAEALAAATTQAQAALVCTPDLLLFDNFNTENGGVGANNYDNFINWTVPPDSAGPPFYRVDIRDYTTSGYPIGFAPQGLFLDMLGSTGLETVAGKVISRATFTLYPGTYRFSFKLAGSQSATGGTTKSLTIIVGSLLNEIISVPPNQLFTVITRDIVVAIQTTAQITFSCPNSSGGAVDRGCLIDDVRLERIA